MNVEARAEACKEGKAKNVEVSSEAKSWSDRAKRKRTCAVLRVRSLERKRREEVRRRKESRLTEAGSAAAKGGSPAPFR